MVVPEKLLMKKIKKREKFKKKLNSVKKQQQQPESQEINANEERKLK